MGKRKAQGLAQKLEGSDFSRIVVFGCAGALQESLRAGDLFLIDRLSTGEKIGGEDLFPSLPKAKITSVRKPVFGAQEKSELREKTGADLVDMEMEFLWQTASPELRKKLIFIRGVIDQIGDRWTALPKRWFQYQKGIGSLKIF